MEEGVSNGVVDGVEEVEGAEEAPGSIVTLVDSITSATNVARE